MTKRNILVTFQGVSKGHEGSVPLLPSGVKKTSCVFKAAVKSKGVGVPSSLDKGKGV